MSRAQIKDHLGLDDLPSHVQDVHIPQGVEMRVGFAADQPAFGSKGGGVQYEIVSQRLESWFSAPIPLGGQ